jgi:esterase/lipase superfamily enzyme
MVRRQDSVSEHCETPLTGCDTLETGSAGIAVMSRVSAKLHCRVLTLAALVTALPVAAVAQDARIPDDALLLQVTVVDRSNQPLQQVDVALNDQFLGQTDETGTFYLPRKPFEPKTYTLSVSRRGYSTRTQTIAIPTDPSALPVRIRISLDPRSLLPPPSIAQPPPNYRVFRLFYATDREPTGSKDAEQYYANEPSKSGSLELGTLDVSVPFTHKPGVVEQPTWLRLEFQFDPNKHLVVYRPEHLKEDDFYNKLAARATASRKNEAFVFIHGYNVTFAEGARKTAQLAADLNFDGPAILYSWPSAARYLGYFADEKRVVESTPRLAAFLEEIARRSGASRIHLIAHSMGNRAMGEALRSISQKSPEGKDRMFRQVVLAAPDIRVNVIQTIERAMLPLAQRVTLYASANDDALILARAIDGVARAGERVRDVVAPGVDAVDASSVRTDFIGHGYFAESLSVLADIKKLLLEDATPDLRNLRPAKLANLQYWIIPSPLRQ